MLPFYTAHQKHQQNETIYIYQQTPTAWLNTEIIRNTFKLSEQRFDMVIEYNKNNTRLLKPKNPCTGDVMHVMALGCENLTPNAIRVVGCGSRIMSNLCGTFFLSLNIKTK